MSEYGTANQFGGLFVCPGPNALKLCKLLRASYEGTATVETFQDTRNRNLCKPRHKGLNDFAPITNLM